jgi:hypothetical protein
MGTTLTGTTPQDTYDSLIKVTDNGPLGPTTAKYLSDGLGNDSVLALSQAAVGIGTTNPLNPLFVSVSNAGDYAAFVENTNSSNGYGLVARTAHTGASAYAFAARAAATDIFVVRADGHVGIGTGAPASTLDVSGTLAVTGNATFNTTTLVVDATNNRLAMGGATVSGYRLNVYGLQRMIGTDTVLNFGELDASGTYFQSLNTASDTGKDFAFFGTAELMRIKGSGNVGIGTSEPAVKLDVAGRVNAAGDDYHSFSVDQGSAQIRIERTGTSTGVNYIGSDNRGLLILDSAFSTLATFTENGLTFNGDTLAANALDDYEEGTFSPTIIGTTTAGTATYTQQNGRYTKIGRLVQFEIFIVYSAGTGTGNMDISGLPFTIGGSSYPSFTIGAFDDITLSADNYVLCWGLVGTNQMRLAQMITGGGTQTQVAYDAAGAIQITGTYSV